jgi:hypothetical protein
MIKEYTFEQVWSILSNESEEISLNLLVESTVGIIFKIPEDIVASEHFVSQLSDLLEAHDVAINFDPCVVGLEEESIPSSNTVSGQEDLNKRVLH